MSRAPVDPLAALESAAGASNEIFRLAGSELQRELADALVAVRELVAADRELDAAKASLRAAGRCGGRERVRRWEREQTAVARRARALAAFGGA